MAIVQLVFTNTSQSILVKGEAVFSNGKHYFEPLHKQVPQFTSALRTQIELRSVNGTNVWQIKP